MSSWYSWALPSPENAHQRRQSSIAATAERLTLPHLIPTTSDMTTCVVNTLPGQDSICGLIAYRRGDHLAARNLCLTELFGPSTPRRGRQSVGIRADDADTMFEEEPPAWSLACSTNSAVTALNLGNGCRFRISPCATQKAFLKMSRAQIAS